MEVERKGDEESKATWKDIEDHLKANFGKLKLLYSRLQEGQGHVAFSSRKLNKAQLATLVEKDLVVKDTTFAIKQLKDK